MPTDTASATVRVDAPLDHVLEHLRDVEATPAVGVGHQGDARC